jgi:hypothetical protein
VAHSRTILDSNLFETSLKNLVFEGNKEDASEVFKRVIDPIFMNSVQLYTYVSNDLPQKISDFVDSGLLTTILDSLSRRIPIQADLFSIVLKFFKMLNLHTKGTEILLNSQAIEQFFKLAQDHRSYRMIVMPQGSDRMFDLRNLVHTFANDK